MGFTCTFEGMCVNIKGKMLRPRRFTRFSVRSRHLFLCWTYTRRCIVRVSDERGTCLVQRPAKGVLRLEQHLIFFIQSVSREHTGQQRF